MEAEVYKVGEVRLTKRKLCTLALLAAGLPQKQVAKLLGIEQGTLKNYLMMLRYRFHVGTNLQMMVILGREGLDLQGYFCGEDLLAHLPDAKKLVRKHR